jgi:hypothetical protein
MRLTEKWRGLRMARIGRILRRRDIAKGRHGINFLEVSLAEVPSCPLLPDKVEQYRHQGLRISGKPQGISGF